MKRLTIILVSFVGLFSSAVFAGEQYLCIAERVSGFYFNKTLKTWENANFKAKDKFVISQPDKANSAFVVRKIGSSFSVASCDEGFNDAGFLHCEKFGQFKFNRKNGRFITSYLMGYFNVVPGVNNITDEESDTPNITIGKCSQF